jgi:hypothetical protein
MEKAPEWPPNFNLLGRIFPEGKYCPSVAHFGNQTLKLASLTG